MIAYLDTNVVIWLAHGEPDRISANAADAIEANDLLMSPIVLVELEYLWEIGRVKLPGRDMLAKVEHEFDAKICELPFPKVASAMIEEKWTREPFDRLIVAQAKANGFAPLISADREIASHYPRTVW